ncbi:MAG: lipid A-modifier LpxR family protein [Cognatishimia sp.]
MRFLKFILMAAMALSFMARPDTALAQKQVGYGRLIVNDFLGDGHDRWRSGSIAASHVFGAPWSGGLPAQAGENIELRILGQVIAPANLVSPAVGDRPYAGALSLGAHTHFKPKKIDYALGVDLVLLGPQTGLADLQSSLHSGFGLAGPSASVLANQIGNDVALAAVAEAGRVFDLGAHTEIRPFAEVRLGVETLFRVGFDLGVGSGLANDLWVRDPVSGHRYRTMSRPDRGFSYTVGADVSVIENSLFLPASSGVAPERFRSRLRAGVQWQGKKHSVFYGASWLSPEFQGQSGGQVVGAIRVKIDF